MDFVLGRIDVMRHVYVPEVASHAGNETCRQRPGTGDSVDTRNGAARAISVGLVGTTQLRRILADALVNTGVPGKSRGVLRTP